MYLSHKYISHVSFVQHRRLPYRGAAERVWMYHIKRDCYADTKNISDSENWQLQIGNGFARRNGGVSRHRVFRGSCRHHFLRDLWLGSRDNFAPVFRRVFLETRTNRVFPNYAKLAALAIARLPYRSLTYSLARSSAPRILELQRGFTIPLDRRQDTAARNSSESCKQASVLGYTLSAVAQSWTGARKLAIALISKRAPT